MAAHATTEQLVNWLMGDQGPARTFIADKREITPQPWSWANITKEINRLVAAGADRERATRGWSVRGVTVSSEWVRTLRDKPEPEQRDAA